MTTMCTLAPEKKFRILNLSNELVHKIADSIQMGQKIQAIKDLRDALGWSLRESKDFMDYWMVGYQSGRCAVNDQNAREFLDAFPYRHATPKVKKPRLPKPLDFKLWYEMGKELGYFALIDDIKSA